MGHHETRIAKGARTTRAMLTEENLRVHSARHLEPSNHAELQSFQKQTRSQTFDLYHTYNDCAESDDGDADTMRTLELRRAASLEALQAYGGCFVSGFLAMQEPLPWTSSPATTTSASTTSADSPRPDSDTLSHMDVQELSGSPEKSWRGMRRLRNVGRKSGS